MTEREAAGRLECEGEAGIELAVAWQGEALQWLGAGRAVEVDLEGCTAMGLPFVQWLEAARRSFQAGGVEMVISDPNGMWLEARRRAGLAGQEGS